MATIPLELIDLEDPRDAEGLEPAVETTVFGARDAGTIFVQPE